MDKIATFVFFDIETTGLPKQERNRTKVTEISFIAAARQDLEEASNGSRPYLSKLSLLINPEKEIPPNVEELTGITNAMLRNAPVYKDKSDTILSFLKELPEPVCLVAHYGNGFDYPILLAEYADMNKSLPDNLLCVDSLEGFRAMHAERYPGFTAVLNNSNAEDPRDRRENVRITSFTLANIYKMLLRQEVVSAHRAEADCLTLLDCVVTAKEFLHWADMNRIPLHDIPPLVRL